MLPFRKTKSPKLISLFSGCVGLDLPFHKQGFKVVWANDIDKWVCETFKRSFGNVIHQADQIKTTKEWCPGTSDFSYIRNL